MCCPDCGISFPKLMPAMFSFNSPSGMCHNCNGLGKVRDFDVTLLCNPEKSLHKGGLIFWGELENKKKSGRYREAKHIVESYGCNMDTPWKNLPGKCQHVILYGGQKIKGTWENKHSRGEYEYNFEGIIPRIKRRYQKTKSDMMTQYYYGRFLSEKTCPGCRGERLRAESLSVLLGGKNINQVTSLTIKEALLWLKSLWDRIDDERKTIAEELFGCGLLRWGITYVKL